MRIADLKVREVWAERTYATAIAPDVQAAREAKSRSRFFLVQILAEDGVVGLGEISDIPGGEPVMPAEFEMGLKSVLQGMDPFEMQSVLRAVERWIREQLRPRTSEFSSLVLAGVDGACFDLAARRAGVPVASLTGGKIRTELPVSWVVFIRSDLAAMEIEVAEKVAAGFTAFKLKVGGDIGLDEERLRLLRQLAGDGAHIKLDANGGWDRDEAVANLRRLERYGPAGIETPIAADDIAGKVYVRKKTGMPILEHVTSAQYAIDLIRAGAVDVFNVSCALNGGIYRARKVLDIAEGAGLPGLLGSTVELGVGTAAQLHLGASSAAVTWPSDLVGPLLYTEDIVAETFSWSNGALAVPTGEGLGVTLVEEWATGTDVTNDI